MPFRSSYTPRRAYRGRKKFRVWLLIIDIVCAAVIMAFLFVRLARTPTAQTLEPPPPAPVEAAPPLLPENAPLSETAPLETVPVPETAPPETALPEPTPTVTAPPPSAAPTVFEPVEGSVVPAEIDTLAVPQGEARDSGWFSDAVMVGDSRVDGFRIYSGITECDYIVRTGMSVYDVADEKPVVRVGEEKQTVYHILGQKQYAKVYLSLGVNELGYYDPKTYAQKYGKIIDQVRVIQPDAQVYVMTIIPVNAKVCEENKQKEWITNEWVAKYNAALVGMAVEKRALLVNPVEALEDDAGELREDLAADGVHFKKAGYELWRDYLLCHTGEAAGE